MGEILRTTMIGGILCAVTDDGLQAPGVHLYSICPVEPLIIDGRSYPWIGSGATEELAIESAEYFIRRRFGR